MKKRNRVTALVLSACLLTGCGAGEATGSTDATAKSQLEETEVVTENTTTAADTTASTAASETPIQEAPVVPKEITIRFDGIDEFHPEGTPAQPYSLSIISEIDNGVTMAYEWYDAYSADGEVSLPMIGENWDCFYDENYTYQWDDGKLSIFDGENCLYVLDYPTDKWYVNGNNARLENGIFYGASVMNGYAQPDTCFMFAYDLENDRLLWRSADQTYNSMNFIVKDDVIFCGYGFTAEDDYLYQLDKNTGVVLDRLLLKKMPDLMTEQDDKLYVHTYSYDYVIEVQ